MFENLRSIACLVFVTTLIGCTGSKPLTEYTADPKTVAEGKSLFIANCASCHDLKNEGIGPRLGGVTGILSSKYLHEFIQNPSRIIDGGNQRALALSRRYKLVMPPFDFLKPAEVNSILAYIHQETKVQRISPLEVSEDKSSAGKPDERLGKPVVKSGLKIELEDFVQIPASDQKTPLTRIANMRPHPSGKGDLFVSDQRGIIYQLRGGKVGVFLDIRESVANYINAPGLGTGLGSFAFHPDYLKNGLIYVTHTEKFTGKKADYFFADSIKVEMQWVLSELKMNDITAPVFAGSRREVLRVNVPSSIHGMQDIEFVPGIGKNDADYGLLFIGIGDGGSTYTKHPELCHDLKSLLGTIIRIDPLGNNGPNGEYGIPVDNPFVNHTAPGVRKEIYAYGFRNPHRMSWDLSYRKIMFSADVGESNFEELNVIVKGGDYGWNQREGDFGIAHQDLKNVFKVAPKEEDHFISPFAAYDHVDGNAISGGYVYKGNIAELRDKYVFGDIANGKLFYTNINNALSDSVIYELTIVQDGKETNLVEMSGAKRVDLRIEYNSFTREMYIMTKSDGKIRRIKNAYVDPKQP
jgi:glucose/arabinose dehydrogenase/mono/diheme cytochrome c family protein